jgi:drug/metabolite transporter (DMT)-like permease
MLYGLGSAIGFGLADLFGAISTRRTGVLVTLLVIQSVDLVVLSALLLTPIPGSLDASGEAWAAILVSGVLGTFSFFFFYRALQLGPIAIVSPVFASYAAITVILSVLLIGERLSALATAGLVSTLAGVTLASGGRGEGEAGGRKPWGGIPWAVAAAIAWGVSSYLIGRYAQETGWFLPVYGSRLVEFGLIGATVLVLRASGRKVAVPRGADAAIPTASGLADMMGVALFARGSEVGLVSVMSAVSATFPLVVIAGGVAMFHERPTLVQWVGIITTVAGLAMLGLGR